jgi:hypothetical protein
MNINDSVGFEGVADGIDLDEKMGAVVDRLIARQEEFRLNIMDQLRVQPQLVNADPGTTSGSDAIQGLKPGDLVYWVDVAGTVNFQVIS